jgi:hypothetical protein
VASFVFYAGFAVLLAMSFLQKDMNDILPMWLTLSIFSIIPSSLFSVGVFYNPVKLQIVAEVTCHLQEKVCRVQTLTFHTKYYPTELNGILSWSKVHET